MTTIIDATSDKTYLKEWKNRVGKEEAERIKRESANMGTVLHSYLEAHIQGLPRPEGGTWMVRQMAGSMADVIIKHGLSDVEEVWGIEVGLYLPSLYAGTTDLIGVYKGRPAIMDYKNARRMKTLAQIGNYFAQLTAYAMAHNEVYGTDIDMGVVFMCSWDLEFKAFVLEGDDFEAARQDFLDRLERHLT